MKVPFGNVIIMSTNQPIARVIFEGHMVNFGEHLLIFLLQITNQIIILEIFNFFKGNIKQIYRLPHS